MSNNGRNQSSYFMMSSCTARFSSLYLPSPAGNCTDANISVCPFLSRHRVVNLFLQGYNKSWISTEDHSFEEKLVEDLAMSAKVSRIYIRSLNYFSNKNFCLRGENSLQKIPESSLGTQGGLSSVFSTDF